MESQAAFPFRMGVPQERILTGSCLPVALEVRGSWPAAPGVPWERAGPEAGGGALTRELSLPAGLKRGPEARRQSGLGQSEPEPMQERGHAGQARGVSNKDLTTDKTGPGTKSTGNKSKQNRQFGLQEN